MKKLNTIFYRKNAAGILLKLGLFMLVLVCLDLFIGLLFEKAYARQKSGWEYRTRSAIQEVTADVLIFGGSRAEHQYDPAIISSRLNQSCFNVGRDGGSIWYHFAVLTANLKRYTPQLVILDLENGQFKKIEKSYNDLSTLYPFYRSHPEIRSIINLKGPFERFKFFSRIYPYNSLLFNIAAGNTDFKKDNAEYKKGFKPLTNSLSGPAPVIYSAEGYELDSNKVAYFERFIQLCKSKSIELWVVYSPAYLISGEVEQSVKRAMEIIAAHKIPFLNFSGDIKFLNDPALFGQTFHVNIKGAKLLTNKVVDSILLTRQETRIIK